MSGAVKKRKVYHWVIVARVSCGRRLWSIVVCYDSNVPYGLIISLTMCLKALEHPPLASQFSRVSFTHGFLTDLVQPQFRKNCCNLVKSLDETITFKPNFYYIVYDKLDVLSLSCNFKQCYSI